MSKRLTELPFPLAGESEIERKRKWDPGGLGALDESFNQLDENGSKPTRPHFQRHSLWDSHGKQPVRGSSGLTLHISRSMHLRLCGLQSFRRVT